MKPKFNLFDFINQIKEELKEEPNINYDLALEIVQMNIDNATIYYSDCLDIMYILRITHWGDFPVKCDNVCSVAYYALEEAVLEEIDLSVYDD
jgi:hypothetical protein